mmetsp:Transcript_1988/g.7870  ORF Transcript_1988/g.7870 Transcript_1988/m.7870 type:complete len:229 (-) Transcript_1988:2392-3078(-)
MMSSEGQTETNDPDFGDLLKEYHSNDIPRQASLVHPNRTSTKSPIHYLGQIVPFNFIDNLRSSIDSPSSRSRSIKNLSSNFLFFFGGSGRWSWKWFFFLLVLKEGNNRATSTTNSRSTTELSNFQDRSKTCSRSSYLLVYSNFIIAPVDSHSSTQAFKIGLEDLSSMTSTEQSLPAHLSSRAVSSILASKPAMWILIKSVDRFVRRTLTSVRENPSNASGMDALLDVG